MSCPSWLNHEVPGNYMKSAFRIFLSKSGLHFCKALGRNAFPFRRHGVCTSKIEKPGTILFAPGHDWNIDLPYPVQKQFRAAGKQPVCESRQAAQQFQRLISTLHRDCCFCIASSPLLSPRKTGAKKSHRTYPPSFPARTDAPQTLGRGPGQSTDAHG